MVITGRRKHLVLLDSQEAFTLKIFSEEMRYQYPLTPESVVFDVGAYQGEFAREIHRRYRCEVRCFEPVFHKDLAERLADLYPDVEVFPYGLGGKDEKVKMSVRGNSSGQFTQSDNTIDAQLYDAVGVLGDTAVAVLKLNCEGGEFAILEAILDRGQPRNITHVQVQPHPIVPDYEARWQRIHERFLETHELTFHAPWCWSGYTLRK